MPFEAVISLYHQTSPRPGYVKHKYAFGHMAVIRQVDPFGCRRAGRDEPCGPVVGRGQEVAVSWIATLPLIHATLCRNPVAR